jgi:acyl carrier protein
LPAAIGHIKEDSVVRDEVIRRLIPIMEDTFDEDNLVYVDSLSADDIEEWDSLSHIRFMIAVEREFGVRFSTGEIEGFKNAGELVDSLLGRAR